MKRLQLKVRVFEIHPYSYRRIGHSRSLLCVVHTAEAEAKLKEEGEGDYKGDSKFASHLKSSSGVSAFAKSRTLKEQREYLPAFACREDLLKVIRENQGNLCVELRLRLH